MKGRRKTTPFPEGHFLITEAMRAWASKEGFDYLDLRAETGKFKDHALSTDRRCKDWVAAWRNWIRKAAEFAPPQTNGYDANGVTTQGLSAEEAMPPVLLDEP